MNSSIMNTRYDSGAIRFRRSGHGPSRQSGWFLSSAVVFLLLVIGPQDLAVAQSTVDSTLNAIGSLYNAGAYAQAELQSRRLLDNSLLSDSLRVLAEQWIAFTLVAQGQPDLAREHFVGILQRQPAYDLDPVLTSPKIVSVLAEARSVHRAFAPARMLPDAARTAGITYRTIVFPGWEQLHHDRTTSGTVFLGAGIAALGTGIVLEFMRAGARADYLDATTPGAITSTYSTYNRARKAELWAFAAFAAVYLASQIDVVLNTPR